MNSNKRTLVIHPFLFSIYPILFLYSQNKEEVVLAEIWFPLQVSIVVTILLWLILRFFLKEDNKTGLILSFFLFLFYSFGHFYTLVNGLSQEVFELEHKQPNIPYNIFLLIWITIFVFGIRFIKDINKDLRKTTIVLNFLSFLLILFPVFSISEYFLKNKFHKYNAFSLINTLDNKEIDKSYVVGKNSFPDIYYIVPDSYSGAQILTEIYHFDNSNFLNYLSNKGFYIANQSKANYLRTLHSIASSLNMRYVNYLGQLLGENSSDELPLYSLIKKSDVARLLKEKGYKYVFSGGEGWESDLTDKFIYWKPSSDFLYILCKSTVLYSYLTKHLYPSWEKKHWKAILYQFQKLEELAKRHPFKEPMFVFIHLLIPHMPMVFDRDGNFVPSEKTESLMGEARYPLYTEQLIFANKKIQELIDTIIASSIERKPIIILQSDEGVYPISVWYKSRTFKWKNATPEELRVKQRILNSYYLPGVDVSKILYPSISPVNSFRVVFNQYFDANLPLLPDKVYAFTDWHHPYNLFDVTDVVKE